MVITIVTQVSCGLLLTLRSKSVFSVDESNAECVSLIDESYYRKCLKWARMVTSTVSFKLSDFKRQAVVQQK